MEKILLHKTESVAINKREREKKLVEDLITVEAVTRGKAAACEGISV